MKQKFNSSKLFLLLIGFLGIMFILKPVLNTNWFAGLMGVLSGFGAAIAYIMVAKLGQLKEPDLRTVYFFTLVSSILSFGLMFKDDISPISFDINLIYLLILGVSATIAQLAITRAYREGKTLNNAVYSYMTVIFSVGWGVWIFQENLDWLTLMGILLIFLAGIFINKTKLRLK
jgi:drug/metabolite transporter (DMT)-like permease